MSVPTEKYQEARLRLANLLKFTDQIEDFDFIAGVLDAAQEQPPKVENCNWCPDPQNPSPESHAGDQVRHDLPKMAHVTGMIGLNQTSPLECGFHRLNWIVLREDEFVDTPVPMPAAEARRRGVPLCDRATLPPGWACGRRPGHTGACAAFKVDPEKPVLTDLFRNTDGTREGKYLVKQRDGTVVEWPSFVLGARDRHAEAALRAYAISAAADSKIHPGFVTAIWKLADEFREYRKACGDGDPGAGRHRKDDPATVAEMRKGVNA